MSAAEAFGPNLRRIRIQHGISLDYIAQETKVGVELWDGLEHNDFSRWPSGIFARAYIRDYARIVGADPESTVEEFCKWFTKGDRRMLRIVKEQAEIVGHELEWQEQLPFGDDRRGAPKSAALRPVRQPVIANLFGLLKSRR